MSGLERVAIGVHDDADDVLTDLDGLGRRDFLATCVPPRTACVPECSVLAAHDGPRREPRARRRNDPTPAHPKPFVTAPGPLAVDPARAFILRPIRNGFDTRRRRRSL